MLYEPSVEERELPSEGTRLPLITAQPVHKLFVIYTSADERICTGEQLDVFSEGKTGSTTLRRQLALGNCWMEGEQ